MLRIRKRRPAIRGLDDSQNTEAFDTYLARLLKLIPAEVVALYLVGKGLLPQAHTLAWISWTVVCLLAVIVVRASATRSLKDQLGPQWPAVAIAVGSFVIWVYSLGDVFQLLSVYVPYLASLLVLTWTFFLPYFYKGD